MVIKVSKNTRNNWILKKQKNYSVQTERFYNSDELIFQMYNFDKYPYNEIKNSVFKVKTKDLELKILDENKTYGLIDVDDVRNKGEIITY